MNLLAFLWITGCVTIVLLAIVLHDEVADLLQAITDRVRHPRPSVSERIIERLYGVDVVTTTPVKAAPSDTPMEAPSAFGPVGEGSDPQ